MSFAFWTQNLVYTSKHLISSGVATETILCFCILSSLWSPVAFWENSHSSLSSTIENVSFGPYKTFSLFKIPLF